ncbi:IS1380 family transposase [candidate division KSB1 bacterium]|nr:IS1380 family transposase [candidate division KSB1 bacterium]
MKSIKTEFGDDRVTSFAGLKPFMQYLDCTLNLFTLFDRKVSFSKKKRNYTKTAYLKVVLTLFAVGYEKIQHVLLLAADHFLLKLLELHRFPNPENIVRCFLNKFTFKHAYELSCVQQVLVSTMHKKLFQLKSVTVDCDSTTKDTCGHQEGTGRHYNQANGYHPIMAFLFETKEFLHGFLRPGDTYTGNGIVNFMRECLARLPYTIRTITFRADSGFFVEALMEFLEKLGHFYVIAAKLYPTLLQRVIQIPAAAFRPFEDGWEITTIHFALDCWSKARKFIVLRKLKKASQQISLLGDDNQYEYLAYCTNRDDMGAPEVVEFYRARGTMENYIKEAKNDTCFKYFTVQKFWSNEALFQIAMLFYNATIWFRAELISKKSVRERLYTFRLKFIQVPGRLIHRGRTWYIRINAAYRYREVMEKIELALG